MVTAPAAARNFKVVKAILSETNDTTTRTGELYVTSDAPAKQYGLTVGSHSSSTEGAGFFANAAGKNDTQCLNVGSLKNNTGATYANFASNADAQVWFRSDEVRTAAQILESLSPAK